LESLGGPSAVSVTLTPPGPVTIGRRSANHVRLLDAAVSRDHAVISAPAGRTTAEGSPVSWVITDAGSTHGTWLNGIRLMTGRAYPLRAGDLVSIGPWTLLVVDRASSPAAPPRLALLEDRAPHDTVVARLDPRDTQYLAQQRLQLLLRCAELIYSAPDEATLARSVLDVAVAGTGFRHAALLKPTPNPDRIEVMAFLGDIGADQGQPRLSRSLIREANQSGPVRLASRAEIADDARSIVDLQIDEALCIPIRLESALCAYLYLDNRGSLPALHRSAADAGAFAAGLARLTGMALANLKRLDIQRRQERIDVEMEAAAEAQRMLLPRRCGCEAGFAFWGQSRPGRHVGGDFFDIVVRDEHRIAVALGDVAGKGVSASLLVTACQGYLRANLESGQGPAEAVSSLNAFYASRCRQQSFMTLWLGLFDSQAGTLEYVNAGHGYAYLYDAQGRVTQLDQGDNLVLGVLPDHRFHARKLSLPPDGMTLVVSDGVLEQPAGHARSSDTGVHVVEQPRAGLEPAAALAPARVEPVRVGAGSPVATPFLVGSPDRTPVPLPLDTDDVRGTRGRGAGDGSAASIATADTPAVAEPGSAPAAPLEGRVEFGDQRIHAAVRRFAAVRDPVAALFADLTAFAASPDLSDDATAVLLRWPCGDGNGT